ncbi:MAG: alanine--glyoxylate aminotransferase family protein [Firmicutes bacterium]|jgi:aspartate aminotransferase-like enzyme|nr:alanine--glyoxylate aminotransferase family protein [Bacillota bacterium]
MYRFKPELRIPGPAPVPPQVSMRVASPMINHRGREFKGMFPCVMERLKPLFGTENSIYMITGSGTSGMEAAVSNLVSPGTPVLCLVGGFFGQRWADLCRAYEGEVHILQCPWDGGIEPAQVGEYLDDHPEIEVIFVVHNESSTGVLNDIKAISAARGNHEALLVVDTVSSLGGARVEMDKWNLDVVISASQKCLMAPPGVAFLSASPRAREKMAQCQSSRYYFDIARYEKFMEKGETPFTPNISNVFALNEALTILEEEGIENTFARHLLMKEMVREGVKALGLELLVEDRFASPTVTAVKLENADAFRENIRVRYGVEFAGGQGPHAGKVFRIGHMGYATPLDMLTTLAVLEIALEKYGAAVTAAELVMNQKN